MAETIDMLTIHNHNNSIHSLEIESVHLMVGMTVGVTPAASSCRQRLVMVFSWV